MKKALKALSLLFIIFCIAVVVITKNKNDISNFEEYKNFYTTVVHNTGEDKGEKTYLKIAKRSDKLLAILEREAGAFIMDAYNYQDIDESGTPLYEMNNLKYPKEIDPNGKSIRVSPNYFKYNPIKTTHGSNVEDRIIYDDCTLNVLVPKKYMGKKEQIIKAYKENFYFEKVIAEDDYNKMAGIKKNKKITKDDLKIKIIFVENEQKYFTFRADCASKTNNYITDPIVQIYTNNIHCNYAHSFMTQWTYIYSNKDTPEEAYDEIFPYIKACNAEKSVYKVVSVYENI